MQDSKSLMELIPAIDLVNGHVVRLAQGDFARSTTYGDDPAATARRWAGEGATRLHIVDLDGARAGKRMQADVIRQVIESSGIACQVAGGLRDQGAVAEALAIGADRVVLGSALIRDPELAKHLVAEFGPGKIVAAIDIRDGLAIGSGWVAGATGHPAAEVLAQLRDAGIALYAVTSIARDGLESGPDLELLGQMAAEVGADRVIASAGVRNVADVVALAARGYAGAILGRALYAGSLSLRDASDALVQFSRDGAAGGA